jgi:uncharacterized protein (DUF1499 family)
MGLAGKRPTNLGVRDGRLAQCPNKPNCVCSNDTDGTHAIAPFGGEGDPAATLAKLKGIVERLPRTSIVESRADYLRCEFTTPLLGFVDDVEFHARDGVVHVRSASRLGYSDLGVNRRRIEDLRARLAQA